MGTESRNKTDIDPLLENVVKQFKNNSRIKKACPGIDVLVAVKETGLTVVVVHDLGGTLLFSTSLPEPNAMCLKSVLDAFTAGISCFHEET